MLLILPIKSTMSPKKVILPESLAGDSGKMQAALLCCKSPELSRETSALEEGGGLQWFVL